MRKDRGDGTVSVILLLALLGQALAFTWSSPVATSEVVQDPFVDANGLMWGPPVKVTDNELDDMYASIRVDADGRANLVYQQSGAEYMWAEVQPPSTILVKEKRLLTGYIPTQYQVKNESTPQPTEFFDIGPDGSIHVVWTEAGLLDNRYQRFDPDGEPATGVIPMNQITELSRLPYIVVGKNGRAYIAFENEGTAWVQMTYVDPEGYIRAPVLVGRPGENVAFARGDDGEMHLFYRSLGADVSLFHVKLDEDRHPIVPNDVLFPNTSKVANPYSSMPTIAITPNGHVHLLISDTTIAPHPIYYIELDEYGAPVANFTKVVDAAHNYGDVVGTPDNEVYIFWDDSGDGEVHHLRVVDGVPGDDVKVTDTGGKARYPQVATDPVRGDVHLSYIDVSGSDREVVYRYANAYRIGLEVDDIDGAREVHPGGQVVGLNVTVTNIAEVPNSVTLSATVDYHGLEGHGWDFELEEAVLDLSPGASRTVTAVLTGPVDGDEGEAIDISISAVPARSSARAKVLHFNSTLTITHALGIDAPDRMALMNDITAIPLEVRNEGDLEEEVVLAVTGGWPGWRAALDRENLTLGPGESGTVDLSVEIGGTEEDIVASYLITAETTDLNASVAHEVDVVAFPTVFPVLDVEEVDVVVPPASGVYRHRLNLENRGLGQGTFGLSATVLGATGEWTVGLSPSSSTVEPGAAAVVNLQLGLPRKVEAGMGIDLVVEAVSDGGGASAEAVFRVSVGDVKGLSVSGGGNTTVMPGEAASFDVEVTNNGNSFREVELSVHSLPTGWRWLYGPGLGLSMIGMGPYSTYGTWLTVIPPSDAPPGKVVLKATFDAGGGDVHEISAGILVLPRYNVTVDSPIPLAKAVLGGEVGYRLEITNGGTGEETFELAAWDLPHEMGAVFDVGGTPVTEVTVPPGGTMEVGMRVDVPEDVKARDLSFKAGVIGEGGEIGWTDLFIEFRLADIRVKDVVFDSKGIGAGDARKVEVSLANSGDADALDIVLMANGVSRTVTIPAGEDLEVTLEVTFEANDGMLIIVADPDNDVQERREDNNILIQDVDIEGGGGGAIPGPGLPLVVLAVLVAVLAIRKGRLLKRK